MQVNSLLCFIIVFFVVQSVNATSTPDISRQINRETSQQIQTNISDRLLAEAKTKKPIQSKKKIRLMQKILNKHGFKAGAADGIMGRKTRTAIKQFQAAHNLPTDGKATEGLLLKLQSTTP